MEKQISVKASTLLPATGTVAAAAKTAHPCPQCGSLQFLSADSPNRVVR